MTGRRRSCLFAGVLTLAACSGGARDQAEFPSASGAGAVAPAGWAFPAGSLASTTGTGGMVTSTDRVASEVGTEIIRRGGNAVDAAVATHFALAAINPEAGNIGGGGFLVVQMADGRRASLDFREKAARAATRDMFLGGDGALTGQSQVGHLASGVPGSVAGMWEAHRRFGTLAWADLVQPAITLADGIVMHDRLAQSLLDHQERLRKYPATAAVFIPNGRVPRVGERFVQRDLADTLRRIAGEGKDGFYKGRTAELIEVEMRRSGGLIDREDLASYTAVWREPLVFTYRNHTIVGMPPPSSGGVAIAEMLNILEGYDLPKLGFLFGIVQGALNAIAAGKRMLSSMAPTIVLDGDGRVRLVTGSPGGPTIITTVVQIVSNVIDFQMNVGDATAAPRVHHQHLPDRLYYEHDGLRPDVIAQLTALGHHLEARRGFQGDAQSIAVLPDGSLAGVSDPRRGGAAVSVSRRRETVQ